MDDQQQEFDKHDFFRSDRFINDPYPYFDYLREQSLPCCVNRIRASSW